MGIGLQLETNLFNVAYCKDFKRQKNEGSTIPNKCYGFENIINVEI